VFAVFLFKLFIIFMQPPVPGCHIPAQVIKKATLVWGGFCLQPLVFYAGTLPDSAIPR